MINIRNTREPNFIHGVTTPFASPTNKTEIGSLFKMA
jgi:hypothetical protein